MVCKNPAAIAPALVIPESRASFCCSAHTFNSKGRQGHNANATVEVSETLGDTDMGLGERSDANSRIRREPRMRCRLKACLGAQLLLWLMTLSAGAQPAIFPAGWFGRNNLAPPQ